MESQISVLPGGVAPVSPKEAMGLKACTDSIQISGDMLARQHYWASNNHLPMASMHQRRRQTDTRPSPRLWLLCLSQMS